MIIKLKRDRRFPIPVKTMLFEVKGDYYMVSLSTLKTALSLSKAYSLKKATEDLLTDVWIEGNEEALESFKDSLPSEVQIMASALALLDNRDFDFSNRTHEELLAALNAIIRHVDLSLYLRIKKEVRAQVQFEFDRDEEIFDYDSFYESQFKVIEVEEVKEIIKEVVIQTLPPQPLTVYNTFEAPEGQAGYNPGNPYPAPNVTVNLSNPLPSQEIIRDESPQEELERLKREKESLKSNNLLSPNEKVDRSFDIIKRIKELETILAETHPDKLAKSKSEKDKTREILNKAEKEYGSSENTVEPEPTEDDNTAEEAPEEPMPSLDDDDDDDDDDGEQGFEKSPETQALEGV